MDYLAQLNRNWTEKRPDLDSKSMLSVGRMIRSAAFIVEGTDKIVNQAGISRAEFEILGVVRGTDRELRASELSTMTQASAAAMTKRLDKLTRLGLVERKQLPRDKRVVLVQLTELGNEVVDRYLPEVLAYERNWLSVFTPEELSTLETLVEKLLVEVEPNRM